MDFVICMAGINISVSSVFPETRDFCKDYLTDAAPDFSVTVTPEDIDAEREKSAREDALEGIPVRIFPARYLETLALYRKMAEKLPQYDTLLFHGSCIAVDGVGYLFTAKSGTGKSTHTALWRRLFGERAYMVNDDKPLLIVKDDGVWACGTPWDGKHRLSTNAIVPLKGICILTRGVENEIEPISPKDALPALLQQTYRPVTPDGMMQVLRLAAKLTEKVGFYLLKCNMEQTAAQVAFDGMQRKDETV